MVTDRSVIEALNFGYLTGYDLLQYCPDQLLIKEYNLDPTKLQRGCDQAYAYVKAKLCNRYDLESTLSNANQLFLKQTGSLAVALAANTHVSRINFTSFAPQFDSAPLTGFPNGIFPIADVYTNVQIGSAPGLADIMPLTNIGNGLLWYANKFYTLATTLYFTITGPVTNINISANVTGPNSFHDDLLTEIIAIRALKSILGANAGTNKQIDALISENENIITQLQTEMMGLSLPSPGATINAIPYSSNSSFKTIG